MDSDSDAPVTPTGLDKPYNPHSNRGRKRTDAEAPSKRSGQMREAQRAHRERKKMYLMDLEAKAKELDLVKAKLELAELKLASLGSSPSPSSHSICSNPSCAQRIAHLENMVSQLQYEAQSWSLLQNPSNHYQQQNQQLPLHLPPNQITLLDDLLNNNSMIASEILFGPVDVTPFHNLKSLDSLKDTHVPDTLVELTLAHTKITQTSQLKLMFFKIIQALNDMFDNCSILDRVKAAEFVAIFLERNPNHFRYISQFWSSLVKTPARSIEQQQQRPERLKTKSFTLLRSSLLSIPSLSAAETQIDEFCHVMAHALEEQDPESFFHAHAAISELEALCVSVEDRTKFLMTFEAAREGNKRDMASLIQKMEENGIQD